MKKLITVFCAAIAICGTFPAYAAEILDRETVAAAIWEDMWNGKDDNGRDYPEASYKHHLLDKWLDENYGSDDYDWSAIGELKREYKKYYRRLIDNWAFHDDNSGGWTIETEDNQYSFLMQCGTWQMIDRNGNTVDSFPPFSTLSDEPAESGNEPITDDKNSEK